MAETVQITALTPWQAAFNESAHVFGIVDKFNGLDIGQRGGLQSEGSIGLEHLA